MCDWLILLWVSWQESALRSFQIKSDPEKGERVGGNWCAALRDIDTSISSSRGWPEGVASSIPPTNPIPLITELF